MTVAVSVSMLISAINTLSLSPALCTLLLRHTSKRKGLSPEARAHLQDSAETLAQALAAKLQRAGA